MTPEQVQQIIYTQFDNSVIECGYNEIISYLKQCKVNNPKHKGINIDINGLWLQGDIDLLINYLQEKYEKSLFLF